jgi:hypothetical protein
MILPYHMIARFYYGTGLSRARFAATPFISK